jgi:hypothetical protein
MEGFFEYTCIFFDEFSETNKTRHGLIFSNSFKDAASELSAYYGEGDIISIELKGVEPSRLYEFDEEEAKNFSITTIPKGEKF